MIFNHTTESPFSSRSARGTSDLFRRQSVGSLFGSGRSGSAGCFFEHLTQEQQKDLIDRAYVLGIQDGKSQLVVLDAALELLGELTFKAEIAYPTLSLAEGNILLVAGVRTKQADGALVIVNVTKPTEPAICADPIPNFYKSMEMTNVWLDNSKQKTVFAHVSTLPTLGAFRVNEKGVVQHPNISFGSKQSNFEPLTTVGFMPGRLCRGDERQASFLISSSNNKVLLLASFDPDFKSLNVLARAGPHNQ
jgi:hypothetical protein